MVKQISRFVLLVLGLVLIGCSSESPSALELSGKGSLPSLSTLDAGAMPEIDQTLDVNVVFVGFEEGMGAQEIDWEALESELPDLYRPQVRFKLFYGLEGDLGLQFNYDYQPFFADEDFEDAFFDYLSSIAQPADLTLYQEAYNEQDAAFLEVADNHTIDAPSVEKWLADHSNMIDALDTSEYTVFFINWYGRGDFKHHVYTKMDEPDPDTGENFGTRDSRQLIAWGGTTPDDEESGLGSLHRIWFYDLSAGPEAWTDNWNVDDADLDGDGVEDYRLPPVWEYGSALDSYRSFDNISGDLGKVLRYVAINLLFTSSPLYNPAISAPALPKDIQLDINTYTFDPTVSPPAEDLYDQDLIVDELGELQPQNSFSIELNDQDFAARIEKVYLCFYLDQSCYGNRLFGIAFGDPFLYHQDKIISFLEGDADYELPVFAWNTADELFTCCLGYADDNWEDGTQSFVFAFDAPFIRDAGYGFTTTTIHEAGHHLGLSHPHDGYDYETGQDYGPSGPFYFAWSGDETNSIMSYIDLNWDFSQFDRDNMNRYMVATYLREANGILAKIATSPRANQVANELVGADTKATSALEAYGDMEYEKAVMDAAAAYRQVLAAAEAINVHVEPAAWQADYKSKGSSDQFADAYIDRIDPDHKRLQP